jgi:TatD DNase family protein
VAAENFARDSLAKIRELTREEVVVAISEVGLDFIDNAFTGVTYHDNKPLQEAQEKAFRQQVALAGELRLPLIVHCRGADPRLISILREERAYEVRGVIHNFDADKKAADQLLDMGFYLSFGGAITYPTATKLQQIVDQIPLDRILIETDSPYMPLYLQAEEKNEPANLVDIAGMLAGATKVDIEEFINITYTNFKNLLKPAMCDES